MIPNLQSHYFIAHVIYLFIFIHLYHISSCSNKSVNFTFFLVLCLNFGHKTEIYMIFFVNLVSNLGIMQIFYKYFQF